MSSMSRRSEARNPGPAARTSEGRSRRGLLLAFPAVWLAGAGIEHALHPADDWRDSLASVLGRDASECGPGYSDEQFKAVLPSMPTAEVEALLGSPLGRYTRPDSSESWIYCRPPAKLNHRNRFVIFRGGRVVERVASYWLD